MFIKTESGRLLAIPHIVSVGNVTWGSDILGTLDNHLYKRPVRLVGEVKEFQFGPCFRGRMNYL